MSKEKLSELQAYDERIIPDQTLKGIVSVHLKRYEFAKEFCCGKRVLDIACGVGYGSHYLTPFAAFITAGDISSEAINYAKKRYSASNLNFQILNACQLGFDANQFDVITSFETIEHLQGVSAYLNEMARVLKSDGLFIVSTPYVDKTTSSPENPHHVQEWSPDDFKTVLSRYFEEIILFGQNRKQSALHFILQKLDFLNFRKKINLRGFMNPLSRALGTTPFSDMDLDDFEIVENSFNNAVCVLAVCKKPKK